MGAHRARILAEVEVLQQSIWIRCNAFSERCSEPIQDASHTADSA